MAPRHLAGTAEQQMQRRATGEATHPDPHASASASMLHGGSRAASPLRTTTGGGIHDSHAASAGGRASSPLRPGTTGGGSGGSTGGGTGGRASPLRAGTEFSITAEGEVVMTEVRGRGKEVS